MYKKFIAGNWKMNKNVDDGMEFLRLLNKEEWKETIGVALFPPFLSIYSMLNEAKEGLIIGAQNCHYEASSAFTGEISYSMLKSIGVKYVIIGHSERREIFKEDDELISKKTNSLLEASLIPILCVGETLDERDKGDAKDKIKRQLSLLDKIEGERDLIIAYEPIWAIGTGKSATDEDARDMCAFIRESLPMNLKNTKILYGGSVNHKNIDSLLSKNEIDGVLVGGASLNIDDFIALIRAGEHYA